ncbi:MAG: class I SAM-dependent methyltransferase [Clostridiales bacterium]|nr:class I SAM-dependent methyltransferase [Clostridiales bacterium]
MGLLKKFFSQTKKPEGVLGKMMVGGMNGSGHARLADWGLSHLHISSPSDIAELGCGGGRNAGELMKRYPRAGLTALDYSALSVKKTRKYNKKAVQAGRCTVVQGNVALLPFKEETFDLATAFETVYFWPGLKECFGEVYRILRPGGTFLICNESDGEDKTSLKFEKIIDGMRCYTAEQLADALREAGFTQVKTYHHPDKPWVTAVSKK